MGPYVNITFVPKVCVIEEKEKKIICDPARLVLTKTPGYCTLKHYDPFVWEGKECKLKGKIGKEKEKIIGEKPYDVDLGKLELDKLDLIKDLLHHEEDPAP